MEFPFQSNFPPGNESISRIPLWEKEFHLQKCVGRGYVSCQDSILMSTLVACVCILDVFEHMIRGVFRSVTGTAPGESTSELRIWEIRRRPVKSTLTMLSNLPS